ncbi:hypothetical protein C0992_008976, partial [Termitomyces sp. T32_za158]
MVNKHEQARSASKKKPGKRTSQSYKPAKTVAVKDRTPEAPANAPTTLYPKPRPLKKATAVPPPPREASKEPTSPKITPPPEMDLDELQLAVAQTLMQMRF